MSYASIPELLTLSQARLALGPGAPCERTLRDEIDRGNLHARRIGRCLRINTEELARWVREAS